MPNRTRADLLRVVAARVLDLRAEFEAQLRAVGRVEEQMRRLNTATDNRLDRWDEVLQRDLTAMLTNNRNIRTVLDDLIKDVGMPIARK